MSELTDLLLQTTDPVVALMLVGLGMYVRDVKATLHDDIDAVRSRIGRLEDVYIPDGGEVVDED
ncbi:hypothetical protein C453_04009 [Haloferax elongans ATCC BAA-1513]|uniref:Uncharacterized protein n=1 Tax=Haloferax elongans ATCC BAA-1513 TaxID=1230453 RepID=M0HSN1_HALEO|nr:hypothetical protein [Haloferax elongans]ELZ87486.1 hypothetical protein C453_04009 [Haloferax elongans ATCC BAA-1513]